MLEVPIVVGLSGEAAYRRIGVAPEAGGEGMSFVLRILRFSAVGCGREYVVHKSI